MRIRLSLSTKIILLIALNAAILAVVALLFVGAQFRVDWQSFLLAPAQDRILAVSRQLALDLDDTEREGWDDLLARYSKTHAAELRLFAEDGRQVAGVMQPLPGSVAARLIHDPGHGKPERGSRRGSPKRRGPPFLYFGAAGDPSRHWVGVSFPIPRPEGGRPERGWLVVGATSARSLFFLDPKPWLFVGCVVLGLTVICWAPFVRGVTKSVSRMTHATGQIAEGQFETQLPVERCDELGQLSASINAMAARLDRLVKGQKRFLGDAAHELCSPLARIQVALGILDRSASPEQARVVADLHEDAQHMSALVNDILSFSKAGLRAPGASLERVDLAELIERAIAREAPEGVSTVCTVEPQLHAMADAELLGRALANVVRNAVRYAGAAGPIEVTARSEGSGVVIHVRDSGPGLPEAELEAVFEPFYRLETARTREGGGVGLGLAIVRTCVEACQGTVCCRNREPSGLEVEIRLRGTTT
jgi:two-component system sensor histidine kinase CpxA